MRKLFFLLTAIASCAATLPVYAASVTVYTYDSFVAEWGPGPKIKAAFEADCNCTLNFVAVDNSTGILSRVQLEGQSTRADVVLGLDNALMADAKATGLLAPHNVALDKLHLPINWRDEIFLPFDYGYFAFIYDSEKLTAPPRSFDELAANDSLKILIQDPRSATPGLGLVLWVKAIYGERAFDIWRELRDNIVTVTSGWSESYGMFLDGEADLTLSYSTSPAYHITADQTERYRAAQFDAGHGMQIEVAAQLRNAPNPALAQRFMHFIAAQKFQDAIPTGNWMYPVIELHDGLPPAFAQLIAPKPLLLDFEEIAAHKAEWVDEFLRALRD